MLSSSLKLEGIGEDVLIHCASYLPARDLARCCAASTYLNRTLSHDVLWKSLAQGDIGVSVLAAVPPCAIFPFPVTFKQLYLLWRRSFSGYSLPLVKRMNLFWAGYEAWAKKYAPGILSTLAEPATERDIAAAEAELDDSLKMPASLRLLYRFHNGQVVPFSETPSRQSLHSIGWGMFGGTAFYDKLTSMRLLQLSELPHATSGLAVNRAAARPVAPDNFYQHHTGHTKGADNVDTVVFAVNVNTADMSKAYFITQDATSPAASGAEVYTNTALFEDLMPCHPTPLRGSRNSCLLDWLEEYLRRLDEGIYAYQPLDLTAPELQLRQGDQETDIHMISLFPLKPLYNRDPDRFRDINMGATAAVTRGVEIVACPAFIPEQSNPWRNDFMWSYSIRMRLLRDSPERPAGLNSCQLTHRHWVISDYQSVEDMRANRERIQEIHGEAVIGLYPTLSVEYSQRSAEGLDDAANNSWPFAYQSCSTAKSYPGRFGGYLDFVPGHKDSPTGSSFQVHMEPFTTSIPDFIY